MDRDIGTPSDLFELSQTTFSLGTARSMAMAGAFTSLGAVSYTHLTLPTKA